MNEIKKLQDSTLKNLENLKKEAENSMDDNSKMKYFDQIMTFNIEYEKYDFTEIRETIIKLKENSVNEIVITLKGQKDINALSQLIFKYNPYFAKDDFPKAKVARITKNLINTMCDISRDQNGQYNQNLDIVYSTIEKLIADYEASNQQFHSLRLKLRQCEILFESEKYTKAIALSDQISQICRKLDDKLLICELSLVESKIQQALKNIPRAKASLTAARANANAIQCPPQLQAEIDMQSGQIFCEESDQKSAYAQFFEAQEGQKQLGDIRSDKCLYYMLLTKIMMDAKEDVKNILIQKAPIRSSKLTDAIVKISEAQRTRSIELFNEAKKDQAVELNADHLIKNHITKLYNHLLELNILKILTVYEKVELAYIAQRLKLDELTVTNKISQMILNEKVDGVLDQAKGIVILGDISEQSNSKLQEQSHSVVEEMLTTVSHIDNKTKLVK